MNDGNMWNREHHNESRNINETEKRSFRAKSSKDSKKSSNPQRKSSNNRNNSKTSSVKSNSQDKLLQELVQQNHTIIGLLRGIKNALISGETHPENSAKPVAKKEVPVVQKKETTVTTEESTDSVPSQKNGKARRQFVMRFDDKEPLNLDLDETVIPSETVKAIETVEKVVETNKEIIEIATKDGDENSYGEQDPFAFFDNK